jgi:MYXO-CTERM domain-containing protein
VLSAGPISFVNGSFEANTTAGFESACTTGLTGWSVHCTGAPPYLINNATYGNTPYGSQFVAIGGIEDSETSYIEQAVSGFTVGNTYTLSWAQSSEYISSDQLQVSFISGSSTPSAIFTTPPFPGGSLFWFTWTNESMQFVANAAMVDFHFQGVPGSGSYEVGVDNFQIAGASSTTPEPSSVGLTGLGGLALFALRRMRRRIADSEC